jgi:GPH family glycoside/pentoside/hexuronide:cation symporter
MSSWRRLRAIYGVAHFGKSLIWSSSELLFAFFLTELCGMRASSMGLVLGASMLVAAVFDVGCGYGFARKVHTIRQAGRVQLPGAVLNGAALLLFAATPLLPPEHRVAFALAVSLVFRALYATQDVPENSVLGLVGSSRDDAPRVELSSTRFVASSAAALCVQGAAAFVLMGGAAADHAMRFMVYVAAIVALNIAGSALLHREVTRHVPDCSTRPPPREAIGAAGAGDTRAAAVPGPKGLLASLCLLAAAYAVFGKLEPYFAARAFDTNATRSAVMVCVALGAIASQPVWVAIRRRSSLTAAMRAAAAVMGGGAILFLLFGGAGALMAALAALLLASGTTGLSMLLWAGLSTHVVGWSETRAQSLAVLALGVMNALVKVAIGMAVVALGVVLSHVDYHDVGVATSWRLLLPMAGPLLLVAFLCLMTLQRRG